MFSYRICSLIANGLLTFLQRGYSYEDFLDNEIHAIYYNGYEDLIDKIKFYSKNYTKRSSIASTGKKRYFELFENKIVTKYMMEKVFDYKISNKKSWMV